MPGFEVFGEEEKREAMEVFDTGVLFRYEFAEQRRGVYKVREFEEMFALYCGTSHAQAVTSGTAALKVALVALGVGPGDEVITQGFTFVATWEAILDIGAVPVFTEIDQTLNMDPVDLERKITPKTRAIIPVHMMGAAARIDEIQKIADHHGIPVIEDTAQSPGASVNGRKLGSFGACGTFSFDPVKTITTGEGGMVITNDPELWRTFSEYQDHGHDHVQNPGGRGGEGRRFIGFNFRMMELQGALGLAQLAKLDTIIAAQKVNKAKMRDAVASIPGVTFRQYVDEAGDSATFLSFMLPDSTQAKAVNAILREKGAGAVYFAENTWHYYPQWEHLLSGATLSRAGWPFIDGHGKRRVIYDPQVLPQSAEIMGRTLVYQVPVKLSEERLAQIVAAAHAAALV
ncbi:MAG: DegT/DnrJ/EryC1/StrS family aminotransferase [Proteobacteria bacterium]|nr:DegT/DnrJ/EryC1/StrS family aminotransferase [Desulfobulbaceae bacterium]MBU4152872.1 DegT/DnrJ/EryC1/StrS family aminotransferase [Pseudomonadota bacterium]MDP2106348.1 DegT/DnrJ/EryC1/StrS family aminotransferase [Desulfobulbaceae bacterium]